MVLFDIWVKVYYYLIVININILQNVKEGIDMNKKIKLLTPVLCGVLLSSSLVLTRVEAKQCNTDTNIQFKNDIFASAVNENYSRFYTYCTISHEDIIKILNYYKNPAGQELSTFLVNNGIVDISHANIIGHALYEFQNKSLKYADRGNGVKFLKPYDCGNLVRMTIAPNNTYATNYTQYCRISNANSWKILYYMNENKNFSVYQLANYLGEIGVTSDETVANRVASLIIQEGTEKFDGALNAGVYVLKSDDNVLVITPIQV